MVGQEDIIVAPATLSGGAIAVVRYSGSGSIELMDRLFHSAKGTLLSEAKGYTLHYGNIVDSNDEVVDDVVVSLYRAPHSYTSEDCVEVSCHGSSYIVNRIIELSLEQGARLATAGEFTIRAYLAGRIDLSQAEAVADMISSSSRATHRLATTQMRGGYSERLGELREELVRLVALLELELDFSEEDVEFADRTALRELMDRLLVEIKSLCDSFKLGNAIKQGVTVAIVGEPNVGKSTLLNRLLGDNRAIVSSIAGTTRDTIEETMVIEGVTYRFVDTAGLHDTDDELELVGIDRTHDVISRAQIVIQMTDVDRVDYFEPIVVGSDQELILVINKIDSNEADYRPLLSSDFVLISAKGDIGISDLVTRISSTIDSEQLYGGDILVSNARHYGHLEDAFISLSSARESLSRGLSSDLLSDDLRHTLHHIGSITGSITTNDILGQIFSTFCVGK